MQPWKTATRKQIAFWIRDAGLCQCSAGDLDAWHEGRQVHDKWTEAESNEFVRLFSQEIDEAEKDVESWLDADSNIVPTKGGN